MTTICVDVMGSDCEPSVLLEGVAKALELDSELKVLVAGDASVVEPFARDHERAEALATTEVIAMDEHPASAVRKKKDASIVRAASAVRGGQADGLFSRTGRHHIHPVFLQHVGDQQKNGHIVVHQKYISVHFHAPFFLMIPQSDRGGP